MGGPRLAVNMTAGPLLRLVRPDRAGDRRVGGPFTVFEGTATLAIGLGVGVFLLPDSVDARGLAVVAGLVVVGALLVWHPRWCLVAVIASTLFGFYRLSVLLGPLDVRASDVPLAMLIGWAIHLRAKRGRTVRNEVGQLPLAVLLLVLGASLVASYGASGSQFLDLAISLLRAVATFSLVWLVPYAVRTPADRLFVLRVLVLAAVAELGLALFHFTRPGFHDRFLGENGPNAEGLIAVAVLVAILNLPLFKPRYRVAIGVLAAVCLVLTKSIASISALLIVLGMLGLRVSGSRDPRREALVRPARLLVLIVGGVLLISTVRPQDVGANDTFDSSSTAARLSFGYAGLQIFLDHPVLGVGWQRSSSAEVIGSEDVVEKVKARFSELREDLLLSGGAGTVHNAYVQVLAEGGLVGILVLLAALLAGARGARAVVARAGAEMPVARTLVAELAVVLIWWNDNPIYGAQPETILFAVFLGLLASIPAVTSAVTRGPGPDATEQVVAAGG